MTRWSRNRRWVGGSICAVAALVLGACNAGSGSRAAGSISGPSVTEAEAPRSVEAAKKAKAPKIDPDAPVLTNLRITPLGPERVNRDVVYRVLVDFSDRNGDVLGGEAEVLLDGESIGRVRIDPRGVNPNITQGTLDGRFVVHALVPVEVSGKLRVFDRAGHQSNDAEFLLNIGERPVGEPREVPKGAVQGGLESVSPAR